MPAISSWLAAAGTLLAVCCPCWACCWGKAQETTGSLQVVKATPASAASSNTVTLRTISFLVFIDFLLIGMAANRLKDPVFGGVAAGHRDSGYIVFSLRQKQLHVCKRKL